MASDTVIGVFSSTAVALGIFIATLNGGSFTRFNSILIGDILSVEAGKIALLAVILAVVVVLWVCSFNQLMLASVHPALADSRGIKVFWQEAVFSAAIAVVVTVAMTWVGLLVINALLVLPAAAGAQSGEEYAAVPPVFPPRSRCGGNRGTDDLLLYRRLRRGLLTLYLAAFFAVTFLFRKRRM